MSFQLILNFPFSQASPPPPPGPIKQNANKNEIFQAGPHLGIINLIKLLLTILPILYPPENTGSRLVSWCFQGI